MTVPLFAVPGPPASRGRLLLVSWHFPPGQSAGALRWQKLAPFVAERGWQLDVLTQDPAGLKDSDARRLGELPPGTRVFGVTPTPSLTERFDTAVTTWRRRRRASGGSGAPAVRPAAPIEESVAPEAIRWRFGRRGLSRTWAAWLQFSQDAAWAEAAVTVGRSVMRDAPPGAVISCGPPHLAHDAARRLAIQADAPLVMDLRDPWSFRRRVPATVASPLWFALADRYEARAVRASRLVVANTPALADALRARYPDANVVAVLNGCDEESLPVVARERRFVIAYAGALYLDRDPAPLFRAAAAAARTLHLTPDDFGIAFIGTVASFGGRSLEAIAAQAGAGPFVSVGGRVSRAEALAFLARAAMLVSLPQDSRYAIPSKVFEYMIFHAWLLALADPGTPTANLLAGTAADLVAPEDEQALTAVLVRRIGEWRAGAVPPRLADDPRFGRAAQARVLLDALDGILDPSRRPHAASVTV